MKWAAVVCACTQAIDRPAALVRMVGRFSPSKATGWRFDPDLQRQNSLVQPYPFPGYTSATFSEIVAEFPSQSFLQLPALSSDLLRSCKWPLCIARGPKHHRLWAPSKRIGTAKVSPARTSLTAWPLVSAWRKATSKESLSLTCQIRPTSPETVSSRPNSFS